MKRQNFQERCLIGLNLFYRAKNYLFTFNILKIGKDGLSSFKSLRIDQSTGAHHHFDLTVDLESGGNRQVHNISSSKEWLGKDIIVKAANKPFFCGIVTNIELHRDGSDFGCIQVSGYSSTYRMETAPSCY